MTVEGTLPGARLLLQSLQCAAGKALRRMLLTVYSAFELGFWTNLIHHYLTVLIQCYLIHSHDCVTCDACRTGVSRCGMNPWGGFLPEGLSGGCLCKHSPCAVGLGLAGASLPCSSDKMIITQPAKGHDNTLTVWYYKPISLSEELSGVSCWHY